MATVAFYFFAIVAVMSGVLVIFARNPVHSVLWLILAFFGASGLFVLLGAEFVAMLMMIVYVGAVAVLFLFVVMMLDINTDEVRRDFWKNLPLAGLVGAVIALEMALVLIGGFRVTEVPGTDAAAVQAGNTRLLGTEIYTLYLYPLQIAAVLLLVAMVAAVTLTLRRRKDSRYIDPSAQLRARKADRLRIVPMKPVMPEAPAAKEGGQP
jgi:NADH-quinone oxidoreductase subunit J